MPKVTIEIESEQLDAAIESTKQLLTLLEGAKGQQAPVEQVPGEMPPMGEQDQFNNQMVSELEQMGR